jgi:hypothetical protein
MIPAIPNPSTTFLQQGNGQVLLSWQYVAGATSYSVQRSTDGLTFTTVATPTLNSFLDTTVLVGIQYFYRLASGTAIATASLSANPSVTDSFTLNGVQFTAVVSSTVSNDFTVAGTVPATLANIAQAINSTLPYVVSAVVTSPTTITLTALTSSFSPIEFSFGLSHGSYTPFTTTISAYAPAQSIVPTIQGKASLSSLRLAAQQRADRVNSNFVGLPEWNFFINQAASELYDILVQSYEDYFVAQPAYFTTNGSSYVYPLPDGIISFTNTTGGSYVAPPLYKLMGVDLGLNNAPNGWVTVKKFNFIDRNQYVFPNTASTLYGVFNLQYRLVGNTIEFIPVPSSQQPMRLWYIPRMPQLLQDTDTLEGIAGAWFQYVIIRAAKYALDKEESDTSTLTEELVFLRKSIEESAPNRDVGQADRISNTRAASGYGWYGGFPGMGGPGGY